MSKPGNHPRHHKPSGQARPSLTRPTSPEPAPRTIPPIAQRPAPATRPAIALDFSTLSPLSPSPEFIHHAAELGIEFEEGDLEKLGRYLAMLLAANESMNLTAVTDPAQAWMRHIFDSLTLLQLMAELPEKASLIDVGSGGGLPGLPLAIVMPALSVTLLEATGKKVEFLRTVVKALGLKNVTVLQGRAEQFGQDRGERTGAGRSGGYREQFDAVTARAVGRISVLAELTVPFAKPASEGQPGGLVLLIKGQKADEELEEASGALHQLKMVHATTVPTPTGRIVVLEKRSATPKMYPRRDGEPARSPIGKAR